jgi:hypothetical protein
MVEVRTLPGGLLHRLTWAPIQCYLLFIAVTLGYEPRWAFDPLWLIIFMDG